MKEVVDVGQFLWSERWRPAIVDDCILPAKAKKFFNAQIKTGQIQNILFVGSHGTGKTTSARAIVSQIGADLLFINGSKENSIDVIRTKVTGFSSTMSLTGKPKIVLIDECDYLSVNAQTSLRSLIENVSKSCRFIMTANYKNKIIDPLKSRFVIQDFTLEKTDVIDLVKQFFQRCMDILEAENIKYDKGVLAAYIKKNFPDYRKILNELQRASLVGAIDGDILSSNASSVAEYVAALKAKDFKKARKFIGEMSIEPADFFDMMFVELPNLYENQAYASAIIQLDEAQYRNAFAVNPTLCLAALTVQLMLLVE